MKKKVLSIALIVALTAILAAGSLAFFTDVDTGTRLFAFAAGDDPDPLPVDIALEETFVEPDTENDDLTDDYQAAYTDEGITYTNVYPGAEISKIPTVANRGGDEVWIMAVVRLDTRWAALLGGGNGIGAICDAPSAGWTILRETGNQTTGEMEYAFLYRDAVPAGASTGPIFTTVYVPARLSQDEVRALSPEMGFGIRIDVYGVQTAGFASAADAFGDAQVLSDLGL